MKKIQILLLNAVAVLSLAFMPAVLATTTVSAQTTKQTICQGINAGGNCNQSGQNNFMGFIKSIVNILLFIVGAVAVIMIIIGGLRYVLSGGDSSSTKSARDTVLYAVVGLIVAVASYAIVNFVVLKI